MTAPVHPDADPGWRPLLAGRIAGRLAALRLVFAAVVMGVLLLGVVVAVLERSDDGEPTGSPVLAVVVAAAGAGVLATGELVGRRQLDCSSDPALANSYSSRFFVRLALAETPALLGFAGYVAVGRVELYLVGAAFALVGLSRAAPTVRRLAAETERLRGEGCGRDLRRALRAAAGGVS